jgi:hypothetical protein
MKDACIQRIEGVKPSSYRVARSGCKPHMTPAARYAAMPGPGKKGQGFIAINRAVHRNTRSNGEGVQGNTSNLAETRVTCQCESVAAGVPIWLEPLNGPLPGELYEFGGRRKLLCSPPCYDGYTIWKRLLSANPSVVVLCQRNEIQLKTLRRSQEEVPLLKPVAPHQ